MKISLQSKTYALGLFALLSFGACQAPSPQTDPAEVREATNNNNTQEEAPSPKQEPEVNRVVKKMELKGDFPAILASETIFETYKNLKNIGKNANNTLAYGHYEYYEDNGKQVLHGQAVVGLGGMGFGTKTLANYRNGLLEGSAYHELATPGEKRVYGVFKQGQLQTIQFYLNDIGDCYESQAANAQGKDFNSFSKELDGLYVNDKLKKITCKD